MSSAACPRGQLLLRHLPDWLDQPLTLIAAAADFQLQPLVTPGFFNQKTRVWTSDWRLASTAQRLDLESYFISQQAPTEVDGRLVLLWPKAKGEGYWWLQQLADLAIQQFYLLGENQGGVKAAAKLLAEAGLQVSKLDSARRCSLYIVQATQPLGELLPLQPATTWLEGPAGLQLFNQPGVFSQNKVDEGSALLLETLEREVSQLPSTGKLLDLGCGTGLLGAWFLSQRPAWQLLATDVNGFALLATRKTLEANGLQGQCLAADVYTGLDDACAPASLDLILSNPPFHTGRGTDYGPAERLIKQAPAWLKPGGELRIVANRFLPYPDLLDAAFGSFTRLAETGKFTVYQARKTR
ncbi:16S rRNA (guanine1207-N2)-methyltransferase [Marinospirillum celere]|uniref:16S rRNA (Guanine1207-N2)-methyltransferase n=1 Tax=Marinospirillum celere TaxID=1122252 RepID=A0A1I1FGF3_9GAMM|nr:methyltransferase [Marinospirillum celere]SFB98361.1 16S rRNA (guanine1207-N2)-methyltransferase [Marinospirillum celere]